MYETEDGFRSRCQNLQRLINEAANEVDWHQSEVDRLERERDSLPFINRTERNMITHEWYKRKDNLERVKRRFRELSNQFELDQCELFV